MPDSHTIAENLTRLQTARTNIATAITTKGGTVASGAGLEDFPTAIGTIPAGGGSQDLIDLIEGDNTGFTIPSGTTCISIGCFYRKLNLASVTIPNTVTSIGPSAFYECIALTSLIIPSSVTKIGEPTNGSTFQGCNHLTSVTVPDTVTVIGPSTFRGCTALTTVVTPRGVASISGLYDGCSGLTSATITDNITRLDARNFYGCTSLQTITFESSTPPTSGNANNWYSVPTTCTIQVPTGSLTAYTTASNYPNPNTYTYVEY